MVSSIESQATSPAVSMINRTTFSVLSGVFLCREVTQLVYGNLRESAKSSGHDPSAGPTSFNSDEGGAVARVTPRVLMKSEGVTGHTCRYCSRFVDDPGAIEHEFPGLTILGSVDASVRGSAGICRQLDRFMDPIPAADCPSFVPRGEATIDGTQ
jgi:hypothetical protein